MLLPPAADAHCERGEREFGLLAGRTPAKLEEVAEEIRSAGGLAETAVVDALDGKAVDEPAGAVAAAAGGIDMPQSPRGLPATYLATVWMAAISSAGLAFSVGT